VRLGIERPGIAYVPVTDIRPRQVALAWAAGRRTPLVEGLAEAARQTIGDGRS
jgi:hypothetical protein